MAVLIILHREQDLLNNHFQDEKYYLGGQDLGTNDVKYLFFFQLLLMQTIMHFEIDFDPQPENKKR
jgi:hypothetical protein